VKLSKMLSLVCLFLVATSSLKSQTAAFMPKNRNLNHTAIGDQDTSRPTAWERDPDTSRLVPWQLVRQRQEVARKRSRVSSFVAAPSNALITNPIFSVPPTFPAGGEGGATVVTGDFNGDGVPDMAVANRCSSNDECTTASPGALSVFLGNGDGTFKNGVNSPLGGYQTGSVLTGDFNRDGKLDLVASNFCTDTPCSIGSLTLLLGNGDGTFRPPVPIQTGAFGVIGAGDLNGDGSLDLVVTIAVAVQPSPFVVS
jgi:hypothetical protein